jgi:hypothetical protein
LTDYIDDSLNNSFTVQHTLALMDTDKILYVRQKGQLRISSLFSNSHMSSILKQGRAQKRQPLSIAISFVVDSKVVHDTTIIRPRSVPEQIAATASLVRRSQN